MTGQFVETTADKKAKIQAQTASALESAKSMILKSVTGKLNDVPNNFLNSATYKKSGSPLPNLNSIPQLPQLGKLQGQKKNQFIVASGNQPMAQLVAAAHAILAATGQSPPAVGAALAKKATIPSLLGKTTAAIQQTQKMNLLESSVPAGSPQSFIATVPNVISKSSSVTNNLLAALQSMSSGPESPAFPPMTVLTSSRKRSLPPETLNQFHKLIKKIYKRRVARDAKDSADKYSGKAIERSKMDMPPSDTQQAPKLMDKIRDMSSVIASP